MLDYVSVNGVVSKPEEAKISVYDRGFLFGDAVYEVTRSYGKVLFGLEEHISRMRRSADAIGLQLQESDQDIMKRIYDFVEYAKSEDMYVRVQVSRGSCSFQQISLKPQNTGKPNWVMYLHKLKNWDEVFYSRGIRLGVSASIRNSKKAMDPNIKSGNYLNNILGILSTGGSDFDDSIFTDSKGNVTEGSTFNIFMVKNGVVITPPDSADILQGITRKYILAICNDREIPVEHRDFPLSELLAADEVFVSSSTKEVMPVHSIGEKSITQGPGPLTKTLMEEYKRLVEDYCEKAYDTHPIPRG